MKFWLTIGLVAAIAAHAQQIFHSTTRLVEVQVVVRDARGPVAGLHSKMTFTFSITTDRKKSRRSA